MKKTCVVATVLLVFFLTGFAYAKGYEVIKKVDGYEVTIRLDKAQPVVGENTMTAEIKDSTGKLITDAVVKVDYSMASMPGMPPMNYKADTELKGSAYTAKLNFSMPGSWNMVVKITRGGKTVAIKIVVDTK